MKRHPFPQTVRAGALLLALAPADAAAQRRGGSPADGGSDRSVVGVRPVYGPHDVGYRLIGGADFLGSDLPAVSGSIALQSGSR